jgi:DNA-binding IclR family transcriptional regulator
MNLDAIYEYRLNGGRVKDFSMSHYEIPNLSNACLVLKALASEPAGLLLSELVQRLELPHTSALRIVATLCNAGFLQRSGNRYELGAGLIPLGQQALARLDIRSVARPALNHLSAQTGETAHLAILSGNQSLLVEVCQSPAPIRVGAPAGTLAALHCSATGKVLLAGQPDNRLELMLGPKPLPAQTRKTLTTLPQLRQELIRIRKQGYAVDEEEFFEGIRCLAAPVHNASGDLVGAIGITGTSTRFTAPRIPSVARQVIAAANSVSKGLGCSKMPCLTR